MYTNLQSLLRLESYAVSSPRIMVSTFVSLELSADTGGKQYFVTSIPWSMSSLYRKGVAKAMLTKVMEEARKRDIHNVYTFIRVDNKVGKDGERNSNTRYVDRILSGGISSGQKVRSDDHREQQDRSETGDGGENLPERETGPDQQIPLIDPSHPTTPLCC